MESTLESLHVGELTLRVRRPLGEGPRPAILLFHGWTGDEESMWIFAARLPLDVWLIAPRAPYALPQGGYSWVAARQGWPRVDDFRPALEGLQQMLAAWPESLPVDWRRLRLAGFSQGAALAYAFLLLHPEQVTGLAALAGFLPQDAAQALGGGSLAGRRVFVSHGTRDSLVPVEMARTAVRFLDRAGASVTYCESEVGHKLSADCFRGMEAFFTD